MGSAGGSAVTHVPDELRALLPTFVRLAQKTYDDWSQDPEHDDLDGGGICHLIADALVGAMADRGIVCTSVSAHIGEVHVYSVARLASGVWLVDIEPSVYERGSAYTWTKIPDVNFEESDITIELLDPDPKNFRDYMEEDSEEGDYEPNVRKKAWVEQLLTKRDKIEKAIGMPLGTMLGCGHWGCAFESTAPWVVKLSIDPTEGPIWSKIAGLLRDEQWGLQGFPEIKSIHRITPDLVTPGGRKKKVWAIVRENVEPVFKNYTAMEFWGKKGRMSVLATSPFTNARLGLSAPLQPGALQDEYERLRRTGRDFDFGRAMGGLNEYRRLSREWHELHSPRYSRHASRKSLEDLEYRINRVVETMFNGPACAPLGESLNMLASHGVYLRDVHMLNIGWHVARDADDWDRVVIFDPGHTPTAGGKDIEQVLVENRRVYHGTRHVFAMGEAKVLEGSFGPGFYFTSDPVDAADYARLSAGPEPAVVACDVDLQNPIYWHELFPWELGIAGVGKPEQDSLRSLLKPPLRGGQVSERIAALQNLGYDGVIVDFSKTVHHPLDLTYYVVFDPTSLVCERGLIGREAL
jgi:hypothetical protein